MAKTRTQLEAKIADDLIRSDLTTQITDAVEIAIKAYEDEPFWFNTVFRTSATLSSSVAFIALSSLTTRFLDFNRIRVTTSGNSEIDLYRRDYRWIMTRQDDPTYAIPLEYCIYDEKLMFDSYADQDRTLHMDGIVSLGSTASDSYSAGDTTAWFNEARELIRHRARREIYMHVLKDGDLAGSAKIAEDDAFNTLKSKTNQRASTGFLRPTEF